MCLTGNRDVPQQECTSSPGMGMCLTGYGDVTQRECISLSELHIVYTGRICDLTSNSFKKLTVDDTRDVSHFGFFFIKRLFHWLQYEGKSTIHVLKHTAMHEQKVKTVNFVFNSS